MIFADDEARFEANLAKWATSELRAFRLADRNHEWRWSYRSETLGGIVESLGVRYLYPADRVEKSITVTSHRPDDPQLLRQWVLANMAIQVVRDRTRDQEVEARLVNRRIKRLEADLVGGRVPWAAGTALVDGQLVACEGVTLDNHWGAFVYLADVDITIVGRHVPFSDLALVVIDSAPPDIDDETARMSTARLTRMLVARPSET